MALFFSDRLQVHGGSGTYTLEGLDGTQWVALRTITGPTDGEIDIDAGNNAIPVDASIPTDVLLTFRWNDGQGLISNEVQLILPGVTTIFHLKFDSNINPAISFSLNCNFDIDWGDGNTDHVQTNATHTYVSTGIFIATITISGAQPDLLLLMNINSLIEIVELPDSLQSIGCDGNQLITLPILPSGLLNCAGNYNHLTSLPTLPNTLGFLGCAGNLLTSLPSLPSELTILGCESNQLHSLPLLPLTIRTLYCQNNMLSSAEINILLASLVVSGLTGGVAKLFGQNPPAPPTGQGVVDVASLISRGWNITTD